MRLYLIKRRSDKAFLRSVNPHYSIHTGKDQSEWSENPAYMLRSPDGVVANLRKLCSEPYWDHEAPKGVCKGVADRWKEVAWRNFDPEKLKLYEVVTIDVDVIRMQATPAHHFAQIDAVASAPLTKKERAA
jgi:hypothetical protein